MTFILVAGARILHKTASSMVYQIASEGERGCKDVAAGGSAHEV